MADRCEMCGAHDGELRDQGDGGLRIVEVRNGICGPCRESAAEDLRRIRWQATMQDWFHVGSEVSDGQ